jgi:hypothetical protein
MRKGGQPVPHSGKEDVFSSSGDPARGSASLGRKLVLSFSAVADGLFAVLFPSTCPFSVVPLTRVKPEAARVTVNSDEVVRPQVLAAHA